MEPFALRLTDNNFHWIGPVQSFIYRCHGTIHEKFIKTEQIDSEKLNNLYQNWAEKLFLRNLEYKITYNEEVWPPGGVLYGSIMKIHVRPERTTEFFIIFIDFTKPLFESVSLVTDRGIYPTNIFNVQYFIENE